MTCNHFLNFLYTCVCLFRLFFMFLDSLHLRSRVSQPLLLFWAANSLQCFCPAGQQAAPVASTWVSEVAPCQLWWPKMFRGGVGGSVNHFQLRAAILEMQQVFRYQISTPRFIDRKMFNSYISRWFAYRLAADTWQNPNLKRNRE